MKFLINSILLTMVIPQFSLANDIHDIRTLEAFMDGVIQSSMEEHHVAGVVVSITTPSEVLLSKGYGMADVEKQIRVNPEETLFRIGSVSKLFVWVPIMQLVEEGKLDLNTDINEYLTTVEVPPTFDTPITIADLMTHTPGFEDQVIGLFGKGPGSIQPLADILKREMPLRVRPPGQYASYSNHGVGIAGLIIEEVTGQSWPDYVESHVLSPLRMSRTILHQPVPESLQQYMSNGYSFEAGKYKTHDFEYVPLAPAGAVSASAKDMVRYLQMFLNHGTLDGQQVLQESTARQMQSSLFQPMAGINGVMHGLIETSSNGQLIMGHGGDTIWFHTDFMIMPEAGIGLYISTNSANGSKVRAAFRSALLERYFPVDEIPAAEFQKTNLDKLVGDYASLRHSHDELTKLLQLATPISVSVSDDDQLMIASPVFDSGPRYFVEESPLIFKRPGYEDRVAFELDDSGSASHLYIDKVPIVAFGRMSGIDSIPLNLFILFASLAVFTWVLVIWTVQHFLRRSVLATNLAKFRTINWVLALTVYLYLIGLSINITDQSAIVFGLSTGVKVTLSLAYLIFALTLGAIWTTPRALLACDSGRIVKAGYLSITLTAVAFSWFIFHWRLFAW